jgi:hypothetical protein
MWWLTSPSWSRKNWRDVKRQLPSARANVSRYLPAATGSSRASICWRTTKLDRHSAVSPSSSMTGFDVVCRVRGVPSSYRLIMPVHSAVAASAPLAAMRPRSSVSTASANSWPSAVKSPLSMSRQ